MSPGGSACQPSADDVAAALVEARVDAEHPQDLCSSGREVVTIWWEGGSSAAGWRAARAPAACRAASLTGGRSCTRLLRGGTRLSRRLEGASPWRQTGRAR